VAQAREYLEKEGYALPDVQGGRAKLSYMLLLLLHAVPLSKALEQLPHCWSMKNSMHC